MVEITLRLLPTPYGWRVAGPDPDRALYLRNGHPGVVKLHNNQEPLWSSDELDLWVAPVADGLEVKLKVHLPKTQVSQATIKAA